MKLIPFLVCAALLLSVEAAEDDEARVLLTSPSGTFSIEEVYEAGSPADWIVSKADLKLRARLTKPHDAEPHTFLVSPDEKWISAGVHYGSRMSGLRLYRRKSGVEFEEMVSDDAVWKFIEQTLKRANTGTDMIRFVGWSPDSARAVLSVPVAAGEEKEQRIWPWYFYYNLRREKFELTEYLRAINTRTRRILGRGKSKEGLVTVVTGEPVDPLPTPEKIRARHEASERRLKELSNSVTEQEKPERREDLQRYQRTWLARRDAGAQEFSMTGPKSERADRRLVYLADANEARLRELEYHLSTLR